MLEENFRRAMQISYGHIEVFVMRPISGFLVGMVFLFFGWQLLSFFLDIARKRKTRSEVSVPST
jgi:TctA family transporter